MKNRALPEGRIEKPEDREWRQWFEKLDKDKHTEYLAKLGLDNEEIRELEEDFEAVKKGRKPKIMEELESEAGGTEKEESDNTQ